MLAVENRCQVSVIVPTYNRGSRIGENIEALLEQDFDSCEIIYVDDGSTDDTPNLLERYQRENAGRFRVVRTVNGGPGPARNAGVAEARGDLLLFTDDDTVTPPDWISRMVERYETCGCDALSGGFEPCASDTPAERYLHHRMGVIFGKRPKRVSAAPMMSFMLPRERFLEVGGFREAPLEAGEDWELCRRLRESGTFLFYDPTVTVYHHYQGTWFAAVKRMRASGAAGVEICPGGVYYATAYVLYSALRFLFSPFWLWKWYPPVLYLRAWSMEAHFFLARLDAYLLRIFGREDGNTLG